jgi:hypothetical protein
MKNLQTMCFGTLWIIGLCSLLATILGCRTKPETNQTKETRPESASQSTENSKPSMERALLHYTEGYNMLITAIKRPLDDYRRNIKDAEGPFEEKPELAEFTAEDELNVTKAAEDFAQGKKFMPQGREELSGSAEKAIAAARAVIKDYKYAVRYYSAQKYKDDQGRGRREIHVRITEGIRSYIAAISAMDKALAVIEERQAAEDLKSHLDGSTYGHQFRAFNIAAMAFVNANTKEDIVKTEKAYAVLDKAYT